MSFIGSTPGLGLEQVRAKVRRYTPTPNVMAEEGLELKTVYCKLCSLSFLKYL